jgi:hypothetical protein
MILYKSTGTQFPGMIPATLIINYILAERMLQSGKLQVTGTILVSLSVLLHHLASLMHLFHLKLINYGFLHFARM